MYSSKYPIAIKKNARAITLFRWQSYRKQYCFIFQEAWDISSVIPQKGESQDGSNKKKKHAKFSKKRTSFTLWYAHVRYYCLNIRPFVELPTICRTCWAWAKLTVSRWL